MLLGATGPLCAPLLGNRAQGDAQVVGDPASAVAVVRPWGVAPLDAFPRTAVQASSGSWLALSGRPIRDATGTDDGAVADAGWLLARLVEVGRSALAEVDGAFALAWFDGPRHRLHLVRDRFGIEPLLYAEQNGALVFASRRAPLRAAGVLPGGLDGQGLVEFLTYCYVPGEVTLDRGLGRVPPGGSLEVEPGAGVRRRDRWYRLSFADPVPADEGAIAREFRQRLEQAVVRRLGAPPVGVLISGGMDSSSVLTFARRHQSGAIRTFGFRCAGGSFDESTFARQLAELMGSEHTEVEYGEAEALCADATVRAMDVPFCDIGINVGTWLLGQAAEGRVAFVLTGDGGDEIWASHPVYAAQRLLHWYDRLPVPGLVRRGLSAGAELIRDSDRKRDLRVKLKRILPRHGLPQALGHFRWRAYYAPEELAALLAPAGAALVRDHDPFQSVLAAYEGYDGPDDGLSPYLYNDYSTASGYYFSRLGLLRGFGIEARLPFYDRALVEFGARIPARLKLEGIERTKRLFRVAMEGVLPDVINHRKDKLGHSVPLKNWLRQPGVLAAWVQSLLAPDVVRRRGLFRPEAIARMLEEHRQQRHNHSHRLWALAILEAWLQATMD